MPRPGWLRVNGEDGEKRRGAAPLRGRDGRRYMIDVAGGMAEQGMGGGAPGDVQRPRLLGPTGARARPLWALARLGAPAVQPGLPDPPQASPPRPAARPRRQRTQSLAALSAAHAGAVTCPSQASSRACVSHVAAGRRRRHRPHCIPCLAHRPITAARSRSDGDQQPTGLAAGGNMRLPRLPSSPSMPGRHLTHPPRGCSSRAVT